MENLRIWDKVQQTDPKYTKGFKRGGGFSGTAINATYQIHRATELWGPLGSAWGYSITASDFIPGADGDVIHVLQIQFRYPDGEFPSFGQTQFVGTNKNGKFTDEEAPKKSLTDAITKALSMLGFSADVFLGLYDDNKYVNDLKQKTAEEQTKPITPNDAGKEFWAKAQAEGGDQIAFLNEELKAVRDWLAVPDVAAAAKRFYAIRDQEEALAVWSQLASGERASIKRFKPTQE